MAEEEFDKSEQPTPFKLREAKRKGSVFKSMELNSALLIMALLVGYLGLSESFYGAFAGLSSKIFAVSGEVAGGQGMIWLLGAIGRQELFGLMLALVLFVALVAIAANLLQVGFIFSTFPLKPDFKRINPVEGLKRLFSVRILYEAFKTFLKVGIYIGVGWFMLAAFFYAYVGLYGTSSKIAANTLNSHVIQILMVIALISLIVGVLDLMFNRREYMKKMRMSRRELKDEYKRREGDPHVKSKVKELQNELRKKSKGMSGVPGSDVIITNPTHFAVALRYNRANDAAPVVVARGRGFAAAMIRRLARKHGVPILRNPPVAQALYYYGREDQQIPDFVFEDVAHAFAWLLGMRDELERGFVPA